MSTTETSRRDWHWDSDGDLDGMYVETRQVVPKSGPSAGKARLVFDFHVGPDDEFVSVWETAVIRSKLKEELGRRKGKVDFEPGERIKIHRTGTKQGEYGPYPDFSIEFEHAAPKPTAADLLGDDEGSTSFGDDDSNVPF